MSRAATDALGNRRPSEGWWLCSLLLGELVVDAADERVLLCGREDHARDCSVTGIRATPPHTSTWASIRLSAMLSSGHQRHTVNGLHPGIDAVHGSPIVPQAWG